MKTTTTLAALVFLSAVIGGSAALAQTTGEQNGAAGVPGAPAVTPLQKKPESGPTVQLPTRLQNQAQGNEDEDEEDLGDFFRHHPGMMGRGYGHHHGWPQGRRAMSPTMMHIIFSLMDADGDGKLTLQEWQAAHERIFKAMDTDHDGTVTMEEMVTFMRGRQ
jgi:hypothetical protein